MRRTRRGEVMNFACPWLVHGLVVYFSQFASFFALLGLGDVVLCSQGYHSNLIAGMNLVRAIVSHKLSCR